MCAVWLGTRATRACADGARGLAGPWQFYHRCPLDEHLACVRWGDETRGVPRKKKAAAGAARDGARTGNKFDHCCFVSMSLPNGEGRARGRGRLLELWLWPGGDLSRSLKPPPVARTLCNTARRMPAGSSPDACQGSRRPYAVALTTSAAWRRI